MAAMLEYEYRVLTFDRHTSKAAARQEVREHAEYGRWELARSVVYEGGVAGCGCAAGSCGSTAPPERSARPEPRPCRPIRLTTDQLAGALSRCAGSPTAPARRSQRLHGHALVDAVEHRGEVEVGGQPQRREAVAGDAEPPERLVVGATGEAVGQDRAPGSSRSSDCFIDSTRSPSKGASSATSRCTTSTSTCSPASSRIVAMRSSSCPGRKRQSTAAVAVGGMTLCL